MNVFNKNFNIYNSIKLLAVFKRIYIIYNYKICPENIFTNIFLYFSSKILTRPNKKILVPSSKPVKLNYYFKIPTFVEQLYTQNLKAKKNSYYKIVICFMEFILSP